MEELTLELVTVPRFMSPPARQDSGQQWDGRNAWPPLQWLLIQGLRRSADAAIAAADPAARATRVEATGGTTLATVEGGVEEDPAVSAAGGEGELRVVTVGLKDAGVGAHGDGDDVCRKSGSRHSSPSTASTRPNSHSSCSAAFLAEEV